MQINLRKFYPQYYNKDYFVEVPDILAEQFVQWEREEHNYNRNRYRNRAHYSLDCDDGIEHDVLFVAFSPCEIYERKLTFEQLHSAIAMLPEKQGRRIYAHYFLGLNQASIARAEGVSRNVVSTSIRRGLKKLEQILKNNAN